MTTLEDQTRAEAIVSMSKGMLKAILDECKVHGDDPQTHTMIVASISMMVNDLDKCFPNTKMWIMEMLKDRKV